MTVVKGRTVLPTSACVADLIKCKIITCKNYLLTFAIKIIVQKS